MRASQFRKAPSSIRVLREQKRKTRPITKWVYFTIIYVLVGWLGYLGLYRLLIITRPGQVLLRTTNVQVLREGRVKSIEVEEGEEVLAGAPLFTLRYPEEAQRYRENSWIVRERWQVDRDLSERKAEHVGYSDQLARLRTRIGENDEDILLELKKPELVENLQVEIVRMEDKIKAVEAEIDALDKQKSQLAKLPERIPFPSKLVEEVFKAPMAGTVTRIYKNVTEVVVPSETVMKIHLQEQIEIRGFFDQEDAKYLNVGDELAVILPGGQQTMGAIERFYFATFPLPQEFQPRFEPTRRSIVVDITLNWDKEQPFPYNEYFYKMGVTIKKWRWQL